jgi:RNA polymerase sigma-70 factor, ECF subfamily
MRRDDNETKGDQEVAGLLTLEKLIREHQAMVYSLAYHFLHDTGEAEELAQEVFLKLSRHGSQFQTPQHLVFWLRKVASNLCIDWMRRRKSVHHVSLEDLAEFEISDREDDPFKSRRLQRLISTLPEKQRLIITLRFQEDLEPSEIAEILEIPLNTVKSQLQRAIAILREKLQVLEKTAV